MSRSGILAILAAIVLILVARYGPVPAGWDALRDFIARTITVIAAIVALYLLAYAPKSRLNTRRIANFKANGRAFWSLVIFLTLFGLSQFAELISNDKPILVNYRGDTYFTLFKFYPETAFGGELKSQADYKDPVVQCFIYSGGLLDPCFDEPDRIIEEAKTGIVDGEPVEAGWMLWPLNPYSYDTIDQENVVNAPSPPDQYHLLGTDDTTRDVLARVIYGFRISVEFALIVTVLSSIIGILAGAVQGFFGGLTDLLFQRFMEIWSAVPTLYIIIIVAAIWRMNFWLLVGLSVLFGWMGLVGVVRAEFLRARNFEYVRAARALGVSNFTIMIRHVLPNAMVATLTMLPFIITGAIGSLAALDFLGFGLPSSDPSLGEMTQQAKQNLHMPHLGITAFLTFSIILSLMVFIFEGIRDAFDPRKTFE